jgi:hypothetical protein
LDDLPFDFGRAPGSIYGDLKEKQGGSPQQKAA